MPGPAFLGFRKLKKHLAFVSGFALWNPITEFVLGMVEDHEGPVPGLGIADP
jgi:hypothetical protein